MLEVDIVDGSGLRSELSTLKANIVDGSCLRSEPSTLRGNIMNRPGIPSHKFGTWKQQAAGKRAHSGARRSPAGL